MNEGLGKDANSVAEYLDNTLSVEKVAEFERICLESDVHLAEVAACHQILTLVLGEPAEIAPELKERIYRLPHELPTRQETDAALHAPAETAAPTRAPAGESSATPPALASQPVPRPHDDDEHWTEAPDYLKRHRPSRWKPLGIAALIAFCLVLAGLRGMGPLNRSHPLARWLGLGPEQIAQQSSTPETSTDAPATTGSQAERTAAPPGADLNPAERTPPASQPQDVEAASPQTPGPPTEPEPSDTSQLPPAANGISPTTPDDSGRTEASTPAADVPAQQEPATADEPPRPEIPMPLDSPPEDVAAPAASPPAPEPPTLINPLASNNPNSDDVSTPVPALPPRPETAGPNATAVETGAGPPADDTPSPTDRPSLEAGRYLSDDQLLLRYDDASQLWQRLPSRSPLQVTDQLLSLPIYRPQVMLPTGMQLTLVGAARVQMEASPDEQTPQVRLEFGRVTVVTFARAGTKIGLAWNNRAAITVFADTDTTLAMEVTRQHVPGTNPEEQDAHIVLRVYPTSGSIEWQSQDTPAFPVPTGQRLTLVDGGPARLDEVEQVPDWVDGRDARPTDSIAGRGLESKVMTDRSAALSLKEQADSRRVEVRSLAACSLAYLGEFDPLLLALNDTLLKSYWSDQYRVLGECLALNRDGATRIREALEQRHGAEAEQLFRMLWGYSSQQLADGGAKALVDALDHESSDFRIAAIENLKTITGTPSLYLPHFTETQRRSAVFKWREKLNQNQIQYAELPEIVRLLENETEPSTP